MERNNIATDNNAQKIPRMVGSTKQNLWSFPLTWWYHLTAPPTLPISASFALRERVRHGKSASIAILIFVLFLCSLFPQAIESHNVLQMVMLFVGLGISLVALFLNRKGFLIAAAILILLLHYIVGTLFMLNYPHGLSMNDIYYLDFSIIPDLLALAFFSANILFLIVGMNALQIWAILTYGPHDSAIALLLQNAPTQIFAHIYTLQLITASVLYLWARSSEQAIARADHAEEIVSFERREKERQEQELVQKRQLDAGIQQILQVHVAVANGDLNARAPLNQDHTLWQVAGALNNLIARLQSLNNAEDNPRLQALRENDPTGHKKYEPDRTTRPKRIEFIMDQPSHYEQGQATNPKIPRIQKTEFIINQPLKKE